jgi:hypothetical protein
MFRGDLREEKAALRAAGHQKSVPADLYLFRADRGGRRKQ